MEQGEVEVQGASALGTGLASAVGEESYCICVLSEDSAAGRQSPLQRAKCGKQATLVPRAGLQRGGEVLCKEIQKPPSAAVELERALHSCSLKT